MALVKCKECGKEISKKAETCPNCGYKPKKGSSLGSLLGACILGTFVVMGVVLVINPDAGTSSPTAPKTPEQIAAEKKASLDSDREAFARIIAEREIKARLKAPSTAKFSGYGDTAVGYLQGGNPNEMVVHGYVDSQNSFGAMLRNKYEVIVEFEEGKHDSSRTKKAEFY